MTGVRMARMLLLLCKARGGTIGMCEANRGFLDEYQEMRISALNIRARVAV